MFDTCENFVVADNLLWVSDTGLRIFKVYHHLV